MSPLESLAERIPYFRFLGLQVERDELPGSRLWMTARTFVLDARRRAGDRLSEGPINPPDILRIKGTRAVQEYLLNEVIEVRSRPQHSTESAVHPGRVSTKEHLECSMIACSRASNRLVDTGFFRTSISSCGPGMER